MAEAELIHDAFDRVLAVLQHVKRADTDIQTRKGKLDIKGYWVVDTTLRIDIQGDKDVITSVLKDCTAEES